MNHGAVQVDAQFDSNQVILQNPDRACPEEILDTLGLLSVDYWNFEGKICRGQIVVAIKIMSEVEIFFRHALELKFPIEHVIPVSAPTYRWDGKKVLADNLSSGFDYREIRTKNELSLHSYGMAFDINPKQNPYIIFKKGKEIERFPTRADWDKTKSGTLHAEHPLVKLMEGFGWEWGGHWTPESGRTDYQHFQKR